MDPIAFPFGIRRRTFPLAVADGSKEQTAYATCGIFPSVTLVTGRVMIQRRISFVKRHSWYQSQTAVNYR
jgi:hypothetical protein